MSRYRLLGFSGALVLAALVGGTLIDAVAAAPEPERLAATTTIAAAPTATAATTATGEYCEAYRAAFAKALGVSEAHVTAAARSAADAVIDDAVKDGKLQPAAADRRKARVAAADPDICRGLVKRLGTAKAALGVARDALTAAAGVLGMSPADLRVALRGGGSLKAIASDKGVDYGKVTAAVLGAVKTDLDAAVTAGTIKQARTDRILDRLTRRLASGALRGS